MTPIIAEELPSKELSQSELDSMVNIAAEKGIKLEQELAHYRSNLIKESIRIGLMELADFNYNCGQFDAAMRNYVLSKDYSSSQRHSLEMMLNLLQVRQCF
jgi:hypothetical protein